MTAEAILNLEIRQSFERNRGQVFAIGMENYRVITASQIAGSVPDVFIAPSRSNVMALLKNGAAETARREQAVSPVIQRAATDLVALDDRGIPTNIKIQGRPYDVLTDLVDEMDRIGASQHSMRQVLSALEEFCVHEGVNFSREASAKPLYVRLMVTDKAPDDLPDCGPNQYTFLDGVRRLGSDARQVNIAYTIHGTKSTSGGKPMGMDEMFERSKKKGLLLFFASLEGTDLNAFDSVDASLGNLLQAMMGGDVTAASQEKIKALIQSGDLPPEAEKLLAALADYKTTLMDMQTPGAVENPELRLAELSAEIGALLEQGLETGFFPAEVLQSVQERFSALQSDAQAQIQAPAVSADLAQPVEIVTLTAQQQDTLNAVEAIRADLSEMLLSADAMEPEAREGIEAALQSLSEISVEALQDPSVIAAVLTEVKGALTNADVLNALDSQDFRSLMEVLPQIDAVQSVIAQPAVTVVPEIAPQESEATAPAAQDIPVQNAVDGESPAVADVNAPALSMETAAPAVPDTGPAAAPTDGVAVPVAAAADAIAADSPVIAAGDASPIPATAAENNIAAIPADTAPVVTQSPDAPTVIEVTSPVLAEAATLATAAVAVDPAIPSLDNAHIAPPEHDSVVPVHPQTPEASSNVTASESNPRLSVSPEPSAIKAEIEATPQVRDSVATVLPEADTGNRPSIPAVSLENLAVANPSSLNTVAQHVTNTSAVTPASNAPAPPVSEEAVTLVDRAPSPEREIPLARESGKPTQLQPNDILPPQANHANPVAQRQETPVLVALRIQEQDLHTVPSSQKFAEAKAPPPVYELKQPDNKPEQAACPTGGVCTNGGNCADCKGKFNKAAGELSVKSVAQTVDLTGFKLPQPPQVNPLEIKGPNDAAPAACPSGGACTNGGDCASCKDKFKLAAEQISVESVAQKVDLTGFKLPDQNQVVEHKLAAAASNACPSGGACTNGGDCASCKDKFKAAASRVSVESVAEKIDLKDFRLTETPKMVPPVQSEQGKAEKPADAGLKCKFGAGACNNGGDCASCKGKFEQAAKRISLESVAEKVDLSNFTLGKPETKNIQPLQEESQAARPREPITACKFGGGACTGGGNCESCRDKFNQASANLDVKSVAVNVDLSGFRLNQNDPEEMRLAA